jgi:1-phosphatidylinositol phosphodiesterase
MTDHSQWMSSVPGNNPLSGLSIPGTHDSWTFDVTGFWESAARTQQCNVDQQLKMGVRFFDLRLRLIGSHLVLYHGPVALNTAIGAAIGTLVTFLENNPRECLIVSIKDESGRSPEYFDAAARKLLADTPSINGKNAWYLGETCPMLHDVRGQMVLFRRWESANPAGINASPRVWRDNSTFKNGGTSSPLWVQDEYSTLTKVTLAAVIQKKFDAAKALFSDFVTAPWTVYMFVNFLSASWKPWANAKEIALGNGDTLGVNEQFKQWVVQDYDEATMITVADFMTPEYAEWILEMTPA